MTLEVELKSTEVRDKHHTVVWIWNYIKYNAKITWILNKRLWKTFTPCTFLLKVQYNKKVGSRVHLLLEHTPLCHYLRVNAHNEICHWSIQLYNMLRTRKRFFSLKEKNLHVINVIKMQWFASDRVYACLLSHFSHVQLRSPAL